MSIKAADIFKGFFKSIKLFCIIYLLAWFVKGVFFSVYYIPTISMSPTLNPGDYIIVNKFLYQFRTPEFYPFTNIPFPFFQTAGIQSVKRGHIIVFDSPLAEEGEHSALIMDIVKRCVGLPGDTLQIYPSKIIINGVKYNYDAVSSVGKDKRDKLIREIVTPKKVINWF